MSSGRGELVNLGGSRYVLIVCPQIQTYNYHPNGVFSGYILERIPLNELGAVTNWSRNDQDHSSAYVGGDTLPHLNFRLFDEWGNPFLLPSNQNVSFTLRLYPGQSSDA